MARNVVDQAADATFAVPGRALDDGVGGGAFPLVHAATDTAATTTARHALTWWNTGSPYPPRDDCGRRLPNQFPGR